MNKEMQDRLAEFIPVWRSIHAPYPVGIIRTHEDMTELDARRVIPWRASLQICQENRKNGRPEQHFSYTAVD